MSAKRQEQVGSERESDESEKDDRDKMSNQKWLVEDGPHKEREIRWIEEKRKKKGMKDSDIPTVRNQFV